MKSNFKKSLNCTFTIGNIVYIDMNNNRFLYKFSITLNLTLKQYYTQGEIYNAMYICKNKSN